MRNKIVSSKVAKSVKIKKARSVKVIRKATVLVDIQSKTMYTATKREKGKYWEQNVFNDSGLDFDLVGSQKRCKRWGGHFAKDVQVLHHHINYISSLSSKTDSSKPCTQNTADQENIVTVNMKAKESSQKGRKKKEQKERINSN